MRRLFIYFRGWCHYKFHVRVKAHLVRPNNFIWLTYLHEGKYLQVARSRVTHQTLIVNIQRWVTLEREKLTTCKTDFCMGNKITPRFKRVFKAFPRYTVMACIVPHTILAPSFPSDRPTGVLSLFNFSRMRHDSDPISTFYWF